MQEDTRFLILIEVGREFHERIGESGHPEGHQGISPSESQDKLNNRQVIQMGKTGKRSRPGNPP